MILVRTSGAAGARGVARDDPRVGGGEPTFGAVIESEST
jgi:hypothetical protein